MKNLVTSQTAWVLALIMGVQAWCLCLAGASHAYAAEPAVSTSGHSGHCEEEDTNDAYKCVHCDEVVFFAQPSAEPSLSSVALKPAAIIQAHLDAWPRKDRFSVWRPPPRHVHSAPLTSPLTLKVRLLN